MRKSCQQRQQRSEPAERKHQRTDRSQHTYAIYVVVTVTLALVSTVTTGVAQAEQTVWYPMVSHDRRWPTIVKINRFMIVLELIQCLILIYSIKMMCAQASNRNIVHANYV